MRRKLCLLVLLSLVLGLCGCGQQEPAADKKQTDAQEESVALEEGYVDSIKEKGVLTVGCKTDVPDLSYYDKHIEQWTGLEVELAYKTAAEIWGISVEEAKEQNKVEFVGVTVADREEKLANGDIDLMLATYTITDERKEKFAFSDSYYTDYIGIMVNRTMTDSDTLGNDGIQSTADLDGKYVGVPRNATTRETFLNYINTMNTRSVSPIFCEYESYTQLLKALKDGNIDAMAVDVSILNGYADNTTMILSDRFGGQQYGAATTKEHAELLEYVNQAIGK